MTTTIPDALRPWSACWPDYAPADVTPAELRPAGIAASVADGWVTDPAPDPTGIDWQPRQARALVAFDVRDGWPLNPSGRTGRTGRNLGAWGENAAADPVVVALTPYGRRVLLIERSDCGLWAIPGGMVDPGESAPAALVRELREETGVDLAHVRPEILARLLVDDPRATDHAWISSTVALYIVGDQLTAYAGSDARAARWWPFDSPAALHQALRRDGAELYPAHDPLVTLAHRHMRRMLRDALAGT